MNLRCRPAFLHGQAYFVLCGIGLGSGLVVLTAMHLPYPLRLVMLLLGPLLLMAVRPGARTATRCHTILQLLSVLVGIPLGALAALLIFHKLTWQVGAAFAVSVLALCALGMRAARGNN